MVGTPQVGQHPDAAPGVPVVVTGLMGAGKTTVASRLAARWGRDLRDSDVDLLATTGRTAAELAAERGADGLHELEARHLLDALELAPAPVVAAAASVVEVEECRKALQDRAIVVWLDADPASLVARQKVGGHRPQYRADLLEMLADMDRVRRPLFTQVADVTVHLGPPGTRKNTGPEVDPEADEADRQDAVERVVDEAEGGVRATFGAR